MSFNVGNASSKYVSVSNVLIRPRFSENVLFATLGTSRKTGNPQVDQETGEVLLDKNGKEIPERKRVNWEGHFVGRAFESAKKLENGTLINILTGWIDMDEANGKDGKVFTHYYVTISDYELSATAESEADGLGTEDFADDVPIQPVNDS